MLILRKAELNILNVYSLREMKKATTHHTLTHIWRLFNECFMRLKENC
jgi:hypothetical protein